MIGDTLPDAIVEDLLAVPDEASITIARLRYAAWASASRTLPPTSLRHSEPGVLVCPRPDSAPTACLLTLRASNGEPRRSALLSGGTRQALAKTAGLSRIWRCR